MAGIETPTRSTWSASCITDSFFGERDSVLGFKKIKLQDSIELKRSMMRDLVVFLRHSERLIVEIERYNLYTAYSIEKE